MKRKILFVCLGLCLFLSACKNNGDKYNDEGIKYYKNGQYEKAVSSLSKAVKENKKNPAYLANLAEAYVMVSDSENAILNYEKALENKADNAKNIYYALAEEYFKVRNNDKGVAFLEKYVNTDNTRYDTYITGFELLHKYGLNKTAKALLEQGLSLKTYNGSDLNSKGMLYFYLGDYDNARNFFDRARESGCKEASLNVARIDMIIENFTEALGAYNYYESNVKKTAYVYNQKCVANIELGNYEDAIRNIEAALEIADSRELKEILYNQVVAYEKMGDYEKAFSLATAFVEKYPDDEAGQAEYRFLTTQNGSQKGK